jgi:DNA-binding GntR family transcriptional regulator
MARTATPHLDTQDEATQVEEPARKKRGALLVHEQLRADIQWMRLAPGSALDEVALARQFGVSRTPIREALLLLANEGFVHFLQNRTTIVAPLSLHNQAAFLDTFILLSRGLVRAVAGHARTSTTDLDNFAVRFATQLEAGDIEGAFQAQLSLYRRIAEMADNFFLAKYFAEAQDASVRMRLLYYFPHLTADDRTDAVHGLRRIVDAIRAGDPAAADAAVRATFRAETSVIQRGLGPRFGHEIDLDTGSDAKEMRS